MSKHRSIAHIAFVHLTLHSTLKNAKEWVYNLGVIVMACHPMFNAFASSPKLWWLWWRWRWWWWWWWWSWWWCRGVQSHFMHLHGPNYTYSSTQHKIRSKLYSHSVIVVESPIPKNFWSDAIKRRVRFFEAMCQACNCGGKSSKREVEVMLPQSTLHWLWGLSKLRGQWKVKQRWQKQCISFA